MIWLLALLLPIAAVCAGLFYQRAGSARDRKRYPPPGSLITAAGAALHIYATGKRDPPVLLEAGIAASSVSWSLVQPRIAEFARTVSYDRAGFAWSGPCPCERTPEQIVDELDAVVRTDEHKWVLVGHSFGALIVRLYASRFPQRVAGLVLVDPPLLFEWADPSEQRLKILRRGINLSRRGAFLARFGFVRLILTLLTGGARWLPKAAGRVSSGRGASVIERLIGEVRKLPKEYWPAIQSHWSRPECFESMAQHLAALPRVAQSAKAAGSFGDLPLIVISGAHLTQEALDEHRELSRLSIRGKHVTAAVGGHWVLLDDPETVVRAVREIVAL